MNKYVALRALLVVFAFGILMSSCNRDSYKVDDVFPQKLSDRLELRSGEINRHVIYSKDGVTKERAVVQYRDGQSAEIDYRTEGEGVGNIKHARVFYPRKNATDPQKLQREIEIAVDGRTFTSDTMYFQSGLLKRKALMVGELYESRDYREDGVTVAKFTQFTHEDDGWKVSLFNEFYPDSSLLRETRRLDDGSTETREYSPEHVLTKLVTLDRWKSEQVTTVYEKDGVTIASRTDESYSSTVVETYKDGFITESRELQYGFMQNAPYRMDLTVYGVKGVPLYRQRFVLTDEAQTIVQDPKATLPRVDESVFRLESVDILSPDANLKGEALKTFTIGPDGKTPVSVSIPDNPGWYYPRTEKTFHPDGSVNTVRHYKYGGAVDKSEVHTPQENVREPLDPQALKARPFVAPPRSLRNDTEETDG